MNRYDFYSHLQKYNSQDSVNSLKHSEWNNNWNNKNDFVKTKDGSNWGESYYKKEDVGGGKWRYFYTKEEYDAYIANKNKQTNSSSADNAKGAGADYQRYLDAQKQQKQQQQQQYNNSKQGAEQAAADRAAREKANAQAAQEQATKQKMLDIVDNYNKTTGNKNGADEFNKAVKKLGLETEEGVRKYGGYEAAVKAVEEEMKKSANNYNNSKNGAEQAAADRAAREKANTSINKMADNIKKEVNNAIKTEVKNTVSEAVKDAFKDRNSDISKRNDQGRDAAIRNSSPSVAKTNSVDDQKRKEEAERKAKQEIENNKYYNESDLSKKNDQGRDAAIKNSSAGIVKNNNSYADQKRKEEEQRKQAESEKRIKNNDKGRDEAIKNSSSSTAKTREEKIIAQATSDNADIKQIAEDHGVSEEYIKELVYNTTGKSVGNNSKESSNEREEHEKWQKDLINEATAKDADIDKIAKDRDISREYIEQLVYNTTGKDVRKKTDASSNDKNEQKKWEDRIISQATKDDADIKQIAKDNDVSEEYIRELVYNTTGKSVGNRNNNSSNNYSSEEMRQKIINDGLDKNADPKALASKYGVSEEYIRELLYNTTGKIFHSAFSNPRDFYSNLHTYIKKHNK